MLFGQRMTPMLHASVLRAPGLHANQALCDGSFEQKK